MDLKKRKHFEDIEYDNQYIYKYYKQTLGMEEGEFGVFYESIKQKLPMAF